MAFGLYFMKSNSHAAAVCCEQPGTAFLLGSRRPDVSMLYVISRALILWDTMNPTFLWVESQLPAGLIQVIQQLDSLENVKLPKNNVRFALVDKETVQHAHANAIAGACFSLGLRYAGTSCRSAYISIQHYLAHFYTLCVACIENEQALGRQSNQLNSNDSIALSTTGQVYMLSDKQMARAAFIASAATEHTRELFQAVYAEARSLTYGFSAAIPTRKAIAMFLRPDWPVLEPCISATVVGLAMVMAGSGDFESLLVLLEFTHVDASATYGFHMAIHMSIGLLFLGGGRASLSRDRHSIATLIAAFFPRFPTHAEDNQYHLQPLRHLWSLAVVWRGLEVMDSDSGDVVVLPVTISMHTSVDWMLTFSPTITLRAPCLLPPFQDVSAVAVESSRYVRTRT